MRYLASVNVFSGSLQGGLGAWEWAISGFEGHFSHLGYLMLVGVVGGRLGLGSPG